VSYWGKGSVVVMLVALGVIASLPPETRMYCFLVAIAFGCCGAVAGREVLP